jgi:DNA-binding MarR family transcriptional regulator
MREQVDTRLVDAGTADALDVIELQSAVLVRNFEMLRRRSDLYAELDRAGYLLLRALAELGSPDIATLAAYLGVDPSTAGRQVAGLVERGLVQREAAPEDRRRAVVTATASGRELMTELRARRRELTADLLTGWSERDIATLGRMFTRYNRLLSDRYLAPGDS